MRGPSLTVSQKETIAAKREQHGWSLQRIALHIGRSVGSVAWYCLQEGIESPKRKPIKQSAGPLVVQRGDHVVRRFTEADDRALLALAAEGLGYARIGRAIGRKPNSVQGRLMTLARRAERDAAEPYDHSRAKEDRRNEELLR